MFSPEKIDAFSAGEPWNMLGSERGFTLIEILIVILILAILAAVAIPKYQGIRKKAARTEAKSNLLSLSLALEHHYAENGNYGTDGNYTYYQTASTHGWHGASNSTTYLQIFKPGNKRFYDYRVIVSSNATTGEPGYLIKAIPKTGTRVEGDLEPWIDQDNNKGPDNFGW